MKTLRKYFMSSFIWSLIGLVAAGLLGYIEGQGLDLAFRYVFLALVLSLLEISISFDNAVVNATVLKDMSPVWRHRFLVWGILIAVFGMRLIFPLAIVSVMAWISPWAALKLATFNPEEYAKLMLDVHAEVSAYGGAFLLLVFLKFFIDKEKETHWLKWIERPLSKMGRLESIELGLVLIFILIFSVNLPEPQKLPVIISSIAGVITFVLVESLGSYLNSSDESGSDLHKAGLGAFLYLEVLDASFSFDGVVGAFAITHQLWIILIGLGIGALFVRSLTIMMVENGVLDAFKYMEHGAFWAVGLLAAIMFAGIHSHIPEWITGVSGMLIIGGSILTSRKTSGLVIK